VEEKPHKSFGIKHSPYVGSLKGDAFVRARTETIKMPAQVAQVTEEFRPRSGTFTKPDRSSITQTTIRTTTHVPQAVA